MGTILWQTGLLIELGILKTVSNFVSSLIWILFRFIMAELIQTEKAYVRDLRECLDVGVRSVARAVSGIATRVMR